MLTEQLTAVDTRPHCSGVSVKNHIDGAPELACPRKNIYPWHSHCLSVASRGVNFSTKMCLGSGFGKCPEKTKKTSHQLLAWCGLLAMLNQVGRGDGVPVDSWKMSRCPTNQFKGWVRYKEEDEKLKAEGTSWTKTRRLKTRRCSYKIHSTRMWLEQEMKMKNRSKGNMVREETEVVGRRQAMRHWRKVFKL